MVATTGRRISFSDLSGHRRLEATIGDELTPRHLVGQAVDLYLDRLRIDRSEADYMAFSRGVRLDAKRELGDLPEADSEWTVMPEVSAGGK